MDQKVRISFSLPAELMIDYAMMQARIKKRECMEWERFANAVAEHLEGTQQSETSENVNLDTEAPLADVIQADIVCDYSVKKETEEPPRDELPPLVTMEKEESQPEPAPITDNGSESGKRTVVRWTQDEDEYLRELMKRFDNDFANVAREMKTRTARQCKSRWELLNRPADETGKKKRGGARVIEKEEESTQE